MGHHQTETFLIESFSRDELESLACAWEALAHCSNYEVDAPINLAVRVAAICAREEIYRRGRGWSGRR